MNSLLILFGTLFTIVTHVLAAQKGDDITLEIPQGRLIGEWRSSFEGKPYAAFESLPFARSPVGKRRYRDPQRAKKWYGVWMAKKLSNPCIQWASTIGEIRGNEDCLYLNVYTPNPTKDANLPVIVYIHGGAFMFGSGVQYGPDFLIDRDVIFVSINYRLGVLGFLSTQDSSLPGNLGMKDQVMALRWLRDYIQYFGGNPKSITITGMSAGGASVHYHMISPMSKGLFQKGISMSGTALCPWTLQEGAAKKAVLLGALLGCPISSTKDMIDCMRHRPIHQILRITAAFMPSPHAPFSPVALVVEPSGSKDAFLSQHPYDIMMNGLTADIPWLSSVTADEGIYPGGVYIANPDTLDYMENHWDELSSSLFDYNYSLPLSKHKEVAAKIKQQYFGGDKLSTDTFMKFVQALGDRHFVRDISKTVKIHSSFAKQPVYYYKFSYQGENSLSKELTNSEQVFGVSHGDDTAYVVKTTYMDPTTTEEDRSMIKVMSTMWASFATNGVPKVDAKWDTVNGKSADVAYLDILAPDKMEMRTGKDMGMDSFWSTLGLEENENYRRNSMKTEL